MFILVLPKDLCKFGHHELVLPDYLLWCTGKRVVIIVPRRVACPYNKVYVVLDVVVDPLERLVDERIRRVAA